MSIGRMEALGNQFPYLAFTSFTVILYLGCTPLNVRYEENRVDYHGIIVLHNPFMLIFKMIFIETHYVKHDNMEHH